MATASELLNRMEPDRRNEVIRLLRTGRAVNDPDVAADVVAVGRALQSPIGRLWESAEARRSLKLGLAGFLAVVLIRWLMGGASTVIATLLILGLLLIGLLLVAVGVSKARFRHADIAIELNQQVLGESDRQDP